MDQGIVDAAGASDEMLVAAGYNRPITDILGMEGWGTWELRGPDGRLKLAGVIRNIITQVGDQFYAEKAAGIAGAPASVTGMRLGTDATAPAKTGSGAAILAYVSGSAKAIDGGFPTSALASGKRRIQWKTTWAAGEGTANGIAEAVITNETPLTDVAGAASNTISRGLLSPTVNKAAGDTLAITWNHDLGTP